MTSYEEAALEVKRFRDLGETFAWCGKEMTVVSHSTFFPIVGRVAAIEADYVDGCGVIRRAVFRYNELPALILHQEH